MGGWVILRLSVCLSIGVSIDLSVMQVWIYVCLCAFCICVACTSVCLSAYLSDCLSVNIVCLCMCAAYVWVLHVWMWTTSTCSFHPSSHYSSSALITFSFKSFRGASGQSHIHPSASSRSALRAEESIVFPDYSMTRSKQSWKKRVIGWWYELEKVLSDRWRKRKCHILLCIILYDDLRLYSILFYSLLVCELLR